MRKWVDEVENLQSAEEEGQQILDLISNRTEMLFLFILLFVVYAWIVKQSWLRNQKAK